MAASGRLFHFRKHMDTNPETEVTGDAVAEAQLEALFSKGQKEEAPPKDREPDEETTEEVDTDETEEVAEEELADLEVDGRTLKLPKTAAEKLNAERLMQADYTRKTQTLAEERKALEERAQLTQFQEQVRAAQFEKAVEAKVIADRLKQYESVDWASLAQQDPQRAAALQAQWMTDRQALEGKQRELQEAGQKATQLTAYQQQQTLAKGAEVLRTKFPNWGPEMAKTILDNTKVYGYSEQELSQVTDPRLVEVLHDAMQYRKLQATKAQTIEKKVATAKPFQQTTSRGIQKTQADTKSADLKARMAKTGRPDDVEAFLAARFAKRK
jgi:hypothetical protein